MLTWTDSGNSVANSATRRYDKFYRPMVNDAQQTRREPGLTTA
jgi:hypothetical protein